MPIALRVPPSIRRHRPGAAANRVAALGTLLIAAVPLAGCGAEDAADPICPAIAYTSSIWIDAPSFEASYGDELPLLIDVCPSFLECETLRVTSAVDLAEPVPCGEPGGADARCDLGADGTLHLGIELSYPIESLEGEREVSVTLRTEEGDPFAENAGQAPFDVQYASGEDCGQTHVVARLELEAEGWAALP